MQKTKALNVVKVKVNIAEDELHVTRNIVKMLPIVASRFVMQMDVRVNIEGIISQFARTANCKLVLPALIKHGVVIVIH